MTTVCDECTVGLANDDWSHLDYHHEADEADEVMTRITAMLEILGWLVPVGDADEPGYFDCGVCGEIQCGGGHLWKGLSDDEG